MNVQTSFTNFDATEKEKAKEYLEAKVAKLMPLIEAHYPDPDTVRLDVKFTKFDKHSAYETKFHLHLPRVHGGLQSSEVKHSITEPLDKATDKLEAQLVKHFKKLTRE